MAWLVVAALMAGAWAGYAFAMRQAARDTTERVERMYRIEPPDRTPGQPTNWDGEPARVRKSRLRNTTWAD